MRDGAAEVADRFFAEPGTKAYGACPCGPAATERTGFHPVARTVFRPRPNVDSALVAFVRRSLPPRFTEIKRVVESAFAHRRKTLPNSLELAGITDKARVAEALARSAVPLRRSQALTPEEFVELERSLA